MQVIDKNVESYGLIKKALDVSSLRSKVIANNLSNVNTPGYKRLYVSFEDALNKLGEGNHQKVTAQIKRDCSTSVREDGNNVDIDNEIVNNAANTLMHNALINEINSRIQMRRLVIKGGR